MASRTGVTTMQKYAQKICKFIALYGNVIKTIYPSNTALHSAIDVANTACATLALELEAVREYGD